MEKNLEKNVCVCVCVCKSLCYTSETNNIVNQLYFSLKKGMK